MRNNCLLLDFFGRSTLVNALTYSELMQVRNPEQLQLVIEEGTEFITLKIQPTLSLTQVNHNFLF